MNFKHTLLPLFLLSSFILTAQTNLEKQLFDMPGVIFEKVETAAGYEASYLLKIK